MKINKKYKISFFMNYFSRKLNLKICLIQYSNIQTFYYPYVCSTHNINITYIDIINLLSFDYM